MFEQKGSYYRFVLLVLFALSLSTTGLFAQTDSIEVDKIDSLFIAPTQFLQTEIIENTDTIVVETLDSLSSGFSPKAERRMQREWRKMDQQHEKEIFLPDPNKSLWYSLIIPGAGQIYNRKYWKLPIVYGGVAGFAYAISWNSSRYNQFSRAYLDLNDNNPNTNSFVDLVPEGYPSGQTDTYISNGLANSRRNRDLSIILGVLFYALTVADAFVDAQLADFDISPDLSMKVVPTIETLPNSNKPSIGCQFQLNF